MAEVVEAAIAGFGGLDPEVFSRGGPEVALKPAEALAISMILHELATNAIKYGALSIPSGQVDIAWRIEAAALVLVWMEKGGPTVVPPQTFGFGTRLIERSLSGDAEGSVKIGYAPEGLTCELRLARYASAAEIG